MSITRHDVVAALRDAGEGWHFADDLPLEGSIQGISNALRHAERYGLVERKFYDRARNVSLWRIAA